MTILTILIMASTQITMRRKQGSMSEHRKDSKAIEHSDLFQQTCCDETFHTYVYTS